jgi:hypothetical protein
MSRVNVSHGDILIENGESLLQAVKVAVESKAISMSNGALGRIFLTFKGLRGRDTS